MATKIILKKSTTGGSVPLGTDLEIGEVAINVADRKLYTKDNSNNIIQVGNPYVGSTAPSSPAEGDLWYDSSNDALKAYNGTAWGAVGYSDLSELEDVTLTSSASGDYLKYNGTNWVNSSFETDAEALFSVTDNGGDGSLSYASGVFTYQGPTQNDVLAHFSGATGISLSSGGAISIDFTEFNTDDLVEGSTKLFHTDARARGAISVTDSGGDGSLSYNSTSGVITYTGPSQAEVLAHISGGTGVDIDSSGVVSIGQAVATTSDVTFNDMTLTGELKGPASFTIDPSAHGDDTGTVIIAGNLTVNGTTTTVNSNEVNIGDSIILLNSDETGTPSQNAGLEIERGTSANKSFIWNETDDAWDLDNETLQNVTLDGGSY